jgi:YVTN family beta-propeller protein
MTTYREVAMKSPIRLILKALVTVVGVAANVLVAAQATPMLYVTNSGGNDVNVISLKTMKRVDDIVVGQKPHGVCAPADGRVLFITIMSTSEMKVVDTATNKVTQTIALLSHPTGAEPNQCASTPDGRYVAVPMRFYGKEQSKLGDVDVISMPEGKIVKVLSLRFPHNCFEGGSNQFLYCETRATGAVYRLNLHTMSFDKEIPTGPDPRPFAIAPNKETLYTALGGFHGFAIVNIENKNIQRVPLAGPPEPAVCQKYEPNTPTHGVALSPDGRDLWVTSMADASVYVYDLARKQWSGPIHTGDCPNWISIAPGGKYVTVSNCGSNTVSVINAQSRKVVADIEVGDVPKRLLAIGVPRS